MDNGDMLKKAALHTLQQPKGARELMLSPIVMPLSLRMTMLKNCESAMGPGT